MKNKNQIISDITTELNNLQSSGLFKRERIITTPQSAVIKTTATSEVLNFCANNYLGLSSHPEVIKAGKEAIDTHGFGMSSVRFICGTQDIHKELEQKIAAFVGQEDAILYAAAFDANGGLFEPLLNEEDAIISDALNHASIIDGIRLCKAKRYRYENNDMTDLEAKLQEAVTSGSRRILIATDGVFSMDGIIAQIDKICDLADKYGTFGKALGGASGGFTAAKKEIVELLRQKSRPYLFSNTLAPAIVGASIKVLDILSQSTALRDKLEINTTFFRSEMTKLGFDLVPGTHPITPVMLYDARLAQEFASLLLNEGIYVIGFFFPVVPKEKARIRVQISAGHNVDHINKAVEGFYNVGRKLGVVR